MQLGEHARLPGRGAVPFPATIGVRDVPLWWHGAKRAIDILVALLVLTVAAPFIVLSALAIMAVSPGSPFFLQERVGENGRRFQLFKLRTMFDGAHLDHERMRPMSEVAGPVFKMRKDPRLHALGGFLRRTSIDEVPNLFNVLRGEMSLVGPRPPLPCEVEHYDAYAWRRLSVKPGITCLWQVSGRSNIDFATWMKLDNEYVDTWTPWGDFVLMARTIPVVVRGEGAH